MPSASSAAPSQPRVRSLDSYERGDPIDPPPALETVPDTPPADPADPEAADAEMRAKGLAAARELHNMGHDKTLPHGVRLKALAELSKNAAVAKRSEVKTDNVHHAGAGFVPPALLAAAFIAGLNATNNVIDVTPQPGIVLAPTNDSDDSAAPPDLSDPEEP